MTPEALLGGFVYHALSPQRIERVKGMKAHPKEEASRFCAFFLGVEIPPCGVGLHRAKARALDGAPTTRVLDLLLTTCAFTR